MTLRELHAAKRRANVLLFIEYHPGTTARDVAMFGGTGRTRTAERSAAHLILRDLEARGLVRRERGTGVTTWGRQLPDRWYAVELD